MRRENKCVEKVKFPGMMLQKIGARAVVLHSILKQKQRFAALEQFKSSKSRILVATDVASRGLDLPHVAIVVNHNVPGNWFKNCQKFYSQLWTRCASELRASRRSYSTRW